MRRDNSLLLSPTQRPLWCCCAALSAKVAEGLGRGKMAARGECREGEREKRGSCPFPLPIVPSAPTIIQKFPIGSLCGGESHYCDTLFPLSPPHHAKTYGY